jgi:hypothetical protein
MATTDRPCTRRGNIPQRVVVISARWRHRIQPELLLPLNRPNSFSSSFSSTSAGAKGCAKVSARASLAAVASASLGAVIIFATSLALLLIWDKLASKWRLLRIVPAPLAVVALGIGLSQTFRTMVPVLQLVSPEHLVNLPVP